MYDIFQKLCDANNVTPYRVCKETGITTATMSNWKAGRYTPKADKMQKIADYFGVSIEYLMTGEKNEFLHTCPQCGSHYCTEDYEDVCEHQRYHTAWEDSIKKYGKLYCNTAENEKIKAENRNKQKDLSLSLEERYNAALEVLRCLFSRSLVSNNFNPDYISFEDYIAMMMNTVHYQSFLDSELCQKLIDTYGTKPGIINGESIYYLPKVSVNTIAAHLDTTDLTQAELDDVAQYIAFVKSKRKK